jgi:hypothetical protein
MTRPNRKTAHRSRTKKDESLIPLLKELIATNKRQTIRDAPPVPDVQERTLKRHRIYPFHRSLDLGIIAGSVTVETFTSYTFTLSALSDSTEFTALFDQYRIMQVRMEFTPLFTDTSATVAYPPLYSAIDYDDANSVTGAQINEYDSVMFAPTGT